MSCEAADRDVRRLPRCHAARVPAARGDQSRIIGPPTTAARTDAAGAGVATSTDGLAP